MMNTERKSTRSGRGLLMPLLLVTTLGVGACDFLDPTDVENPQTTGDDLLQAEAPTSALLPGLRAQMARLVSSTTVVSEVVSDNFSIHGTGLFKEWDSPRSVTPSVNNSTGTATGLYWNAQELKALANFVIDEIAPNDPTAQPAHVAEAYYYRGMALLMLAENFSGAPLQEDGPIVPAGQILDLAIADFGQAGAFGVATAAATARAQRWKGDRAAARTAALAALSVDGDFAILQEYDASSISNQPFSFLVLRALQEMQPLPRLDFLDPKYLNREAGIAVAKAEEMHLIMAEAALAGGDLPTARTSLRNAIQLAKNRSTSSFEDGDQRLNADLTIRPRSASIQVRADANAPYRAGLVLSRPGSVSQHTLSGTSLNADSVAALGTAAELWHALNLARQEILFLEGRRMADLGIRLPIMLREIDANPNINQGDLGTEAVVPAYIPADDGMDLYTPVSPYSASETLTTNQITIQFDMNRILAQNNASPFVS
ncbi:MAG: hypothetical protein RJQ04_10025 [Longimicrobiales bacterium]